MVSGQYVKNLYHSLVFVVSVVEDHITFFTHRYISDTHRRVFRECLSILSDSVVILTLQRIRVGISQTPILVFMNTSETLHRTFGVFTTQDKIRGVRRVRTDVYS